MKAELMNSTPARWYTLVGLVLVPLLVAGGFLLAGVNADSRQDSVKAAVVNHFRIKIVFYDLEW